MNLDETTQLVTTAGMLYPAWWSKLDKLAQAATFAAWTSMLEDMPLDVGLAALKRHAATNKWPPSVAEIRAIATEAVVGRRRSGLDAWGDVRKAIGRWGLPGIDGKGTAPQFADELVARVVASMHWPSICNSTNEVADRAHFAKAYDALAVGAAEDATVHSLPGVARPKLPDGSPAALVGDLARRLTGGVS